MLHIEVQDVDKSMFHKSEAYSFMRRRFRVLEGVLASHCCCIYMDNTNARRCCYGDGIEFW